PALICLLVVFTIPRPPGCSPFPYTTLFRFALDDRAGQLAVDEIDEALQDRVGPQQDARVGSGDARLGRHRGSLVELQHGVGFTQDRKSTRLNSSHVKISYAVFCLKKKKNNR